MRPLFESAISGGKEACSGEESTASDRRKRRRVSVEGQHLELTRDAEGTDREKRETEEEGVADERGEDDAGVEADGRDGRLHVDPLHDEGMMLG